MNCPNCQRQNPATAKFCIYCATELAPATPEVQVAPTPAVGPTVRLEPAPTPAYTLPTQPQPTPTPVPAAGPAKPRWNYDDGAIGAVFLIGLGALILTGNVFPGILVLIGITSYMKQMRRGHSERALQPLVFFVGMAVLFATGAFFPGILFLIGAMYLLGRGKHHGRGWC